MKIVASLSIAALIASATAQSISDLPQCARACAVDALPASCQTSDFKCICSSKSFISSISCCVLKSCDTADIQTTIEVAGKLCAAFGVTLPTAAGCPSATGASASSSTATSSSSGSTTGSSSSASSAASSTSASSSATVASTASPSSSTGATSSEGSSTTPASSGSSTTASAASASSSGAAAAIVYGQQGDILAAVGGAAAFIAALLA